MMEYICAYPMIRQDSSVSDAASVASSEWSDLVASPYRDPLFERHLNKWGSFLVQDQAGLSWDSLQLLFKLEYEPQPMPAGMFSTTSQERFDETLARMRTENKTKVLFQMSTCIFPSPEVLHSSGAPISPRLCETNNVPWNNMPAFFTGAKFQEEPLARPDFGVGFHKDSFNANQLLKLRPFLGADDSAYSPFTATSDMYFPFLTCQVKTGVAALDTANLENAFAQSLGLRGLFQLFKRVGHHMELDRELSGFSVSHNAETVNVYGHYIVVEAGKPKFYRLTLAEIDLSAQPHRRYYTYRFLRNLYSEWVPVHFSRICKAINALSQPGHWNSSSLA